MTVAQRSREEEKRRQAEAYVDEERKVKTLGDVISRGISKVTAFIIDSREKKGAEERLERELDLRIKKLEAIYNSSVNPLVRKAIITAIDGMKSEYSISIMEIERIYGTNNKVEDKVLSYKRVVASVLEEMDAITAAVKKEIEGIKGS